MDFYQKNKNLETKIKDAVKKTVSSIKDPEIKRIILQRQETSSYLKGLSSYYIFKGLSKKYNESENIELSKNIELWSTGLVILDNITDNHKIRNNQTTFLEEFGIAKNAVASSYSTHVGMLGLSKYISILNEQTTDLGKLSTSNSVDGAIKMDLIKPSSTREIMDSIAKVNGLTLALPLSISAAAGGGDKGIIYDILKYGYDTGIAFRLFEELRDLVGKHGRKKASEIQEGRTPYYLARAIERKNKKELKSFIGKNLNSKEYQEMICLLKETSSINHISNLILNYLEYGRKRIE